ncbi:MAG: precorrin-6A reductase [Eubacterium sp.]
MILVLGGTYDSRKLTEALLEKEQQVVYSSVTEYNTSSLPDSHLLTQSIGCLDEKGLCALIADKKITACVDATHPYASEVSVNAINACSRMSIQYVRMERPRLMDDGKNVRGFSSYEEAVVYLKQQEGNILLTTGSRQLEYYQPLSKERLIIRVLPTSKVLKKCEDLGYKPKNIIAVQGPFSYAANVNTIKEYDIRFLVTKDGGDVGGGAEKLKAAADLGVQTVFIKRPQINYPMVRSDVQGIMEILI